MPREPHKRGHEKSGSEVWVTTAIDLKSPLEYFFWASLSYEPLSYEPLSYEPNISVWVSCSGEEYIVQQ